MIKNSPFYYLILNCILIILVCSCSDDLPENIIVDDSNLVELIDLSNDLEVGSVIQLETNSDVLLGQNPYKIKLYENKLYVFDPIIGGGLYIFNMRGELINKIVENGGEGNFALYQAQDFVLIPESNQFAIMDLKLKSVLFFDLQTYEYTDEILLPNPYVNFEYLNGKFYLNPSKRSDFEFGEFIEVWNDDLTNLEYSYFPYSENSNGNFRLSQKININSEKLVFWEAFNDTIYTIDLNNQSSNKIYVDFAKKLPKDLYDKTLQEKVEYVQQATSINTFINNVVSENDFLLFNFSADIGSLNYYLAKDQEYISNRLKVDDLEMDKIIGYVNDDYLYTLIPDNTDRNNVKVILLKIK